MRGKKERNKTKQNKETTKNKKINNLFKFFSAVVKNPPNNLWIIAAVLAPISVVTLIIIIITAVLCRKNKNDFKADAIGNLNPRAKVFILFMY